ncbi:ubiquitin-like protein Pup [Bifidobacterium oedipodis]|uniref:Prokaryotic ubiquitin-like protein Pup n=1 Tax=Bifidobacterium oedipodis TaxID=2675322 RepID=A0A7Y0HTG8_9BIFI|nr:ubiquitin-like protein Pup [Bifidobacterium sp. DSM 109957]NMM93664.1 Prokaryotic ubiquitin-like protein Pup [Bifidobacterium sp. DSM 109957]
MPQQFEQAHPQQTSSDIEETILTSSQETQDQSDVLDDILDDIESTLETNAEEYVNSFVQKGGE